MATRQATMIGFIARIARVTMRPAICRKKTDMIRRMDADVAALIALFAGVPGKEQMVEQTSTAVDSC